MIILLGPRPPRLIPPRREHWSSGFFHPSGLGRPFLSCWFSTPDASAPRRRNPLDCRSEGQNLRTGQRRDHRHPSRGRRRCPHLREAHRPLFRSDRPASHNLIPRHGIQRAAYSSLRLRLRGGDPSSHLAPDHSCFARRKIRLLNAGEAANAGVDARFERGQRHS